MSFCNECSGKLTERLLSIIELFAVTGSGGELATKRDLNKWKEEIMVKVSELKNEVVGMRAQVQKIAAEQQTAYDALVAKFDALQATLNDQELPPDVNQEIAGFKTDLQAFDDKIPDTAP